MDFDECLRKKIVKNISVDFELVESLKKTSINKFVSQEKLELTEVTAGSKISLLYDSLRELLGALAVMNGYKIYNHECYTCFLKEILNESMRGDEFDEIRKIRNAINDYAKEISVSEARDVLIRINILREEIIGMLDSNSI